MRGKSIKVFPYILKDDFENPDKERTVWKLRPILPGDSAKWMTRLKEAEVQKKGGRIEYKQGKLQRATFDSFTDVIESVENWHFSTDEEDLDKLGFTEVDGSDESKMKIVYNELSNEQINELIDAADERTSNLVEVTRKKSKSERGIKSGDLTSQ